MVIGISAAEGVHSLLSLDCQDIRFFDAGSLLHQGRHAARQDAAIQSADDFDRPILMKVVKQAARNTGPIVNWH